MSLDFSDLSKFDSLSAKPKKFSFLNDLGLSKEVISKLSLNLSRTVSGSSEVYLTPLGKDNNPDDLLSELDDLFLRDSRFINLNLRNLEQSNKDKFGPRSISKPWSSRVSSLSDYFEHQGDSQNLKLDVIIPNSRSNWLRPLSLESGISYLKRNTNSGLPNYTRKSKVLDDLPSTFYSQLSSKYPCVLFTRTQEGGKTRNVWGYPISDTLNEMLFYQPFLSFTKTLSFRSALLGPDYVDRRVTSLMLEGRASGNNFLSVDFSAFDASVGQALQSKCFDFIKSCFQKEYSDRLDYIRDRFNSIGIITPNGVIDGPHGVPSGATFTNEVDSLAQYIVAVNSGLINDRSNFQIQGDDGLYSLKASDVDVLIKSFSEAGLKVNDDKSYNDPSYCVYLQRLYDFDYYNNGLIGGIYSIYRALNRLVYQERYSDFEDYSLSGVDYYSIRAISILENCKYHPLFKEFVKFIYSKDKFKLSFSNESVKNYSSMVRNGSGTQGFLNNQFGDNITGIFSFDTVRVIKELG